MNFYSVILAAVVITVCNSTEHGSIPSHVNDETSRSSSAPSSRVNVELYYESLCYDSIQFVKYQLLPAYRDLKDHVKVTYIPYGKASHAKVVNRDGTEKWHFTCQHGPSECRGNKAQACAIDDILTNPERPDKQQDLVNLVGCAMSASDPSSAVPRCLETIGVDANHRSLVNDCIAHSKGDDLLAAYGDKTHNVQPNIDFVPTIVINGVFSHDNQRNALRNFKSTICHHISAENKPSTCLSR